MNRLDFLKVSGATAAAFMFCPAVASSGKSRKKKRMGRIGLTTVVFRNRFRTTSKKVPVDPLELKDVPAYFSQRFNIRNLEFWSPHFENLEENYLQELKDEIREERCELVNIQVDTPGLDVSSNDAKNREKAVQTMMEWIDRGSLLGSKMVRVSSMKGSMEHAVSSVRTLNAYASSKGIKLLIENHNDLFSKPENHLRIVKEISDPVPGLIADFGNYPVDTDHLAALKLIAPYTSIVSAKVKEFDEEYNHVSYDFRKCVEVMEANGFTGIYSIEQWSSPKFEYDSEKIVDRIIEELTEHIL
jgi:sugar phosphate isomerase/epimerase